MKRHRDSLCSMESPLKSSGILETLASEDFPSINSYNEDLDVSIDED